MRVRSLFVGLIMSFFLPGRSRDPRSYDEQKPQIFITSSKRQSNIISRDIFFVSHYGEELVELGGREVSVAVRVVLVKELVEQRSLFHFLLTILHAFSKQNRVKRYVQTRVRLTITQRSNSSNVISPSTSPICTEKQVSVVNHIQQNDLKYSQHRIQYLRIVRPASRWFRAMRVVSWISTNLRKKQFGSRNNEPCILRLTFDVFSIDGARMIGIVFVKQSSKLQKNIRVS